VVGVFDRKSSEFEWDGFSIASHYDEKALGLAEDFKASEKFAFPIRQ